LIQIINIKLLYITMSKAKTIDIDSVTNADLERFWAKVDDSDSYGCWPWTDSTSRGYGKFGFQGRKLTAHRFAFFVSRTKPLEQDPDAHICHSCDNRLCCNPTHLRQDTKSSNNKDKRKNGNASPIQKLTCEQVDEIKALLKEGKLLQRQIAEKFGVKQPIISQIKTGSRWSD
jgi:hypothetical protein